MNHKTFTDSLQVAILQSLLEFRQQHYDTPYAFALLGSTTADSIDFAIATEEGLRRIAEKYDELGYRYSAHEWERFENIEKLAVWLRWANPDDGWYFGAFPEQFDINANLAELMEAAVPGQEAPDLEELCVGVLASMPSLAGWREAVTGLVLVLGFTYGEDPRDFLRSATRANEYPVVRRLWSEQFFCEEMSSRILSPHRRERK
ncbi:MAG TPA: DUF4303 domain-containing protein [Pirellulales bacterium]|nr:DUF4303 domain-containing protein [Pirellulales bacterium]